MADHGRGELAGRLLEAQQRQTALLLRMRDHAANIDQTRKALGNPFFYGGRPDADPESKSVYTGYASHEPAFQLWRESRELRELIADIRLQLRSLE